MNKLVTHTNINQKIRVLTGDNTLVLVDVSVSVFSRTTHYIWYTGRHPRLDTEVQEDNPDTPLSLREPF